MEPIKDNDTSKKLSKTSTSIKMSKRFKTAKMVIFKGNYTPNYGIDLRFSGLFTYQRPNKENEDLKEAMKKHEGPMVKTAKRMIFKRYSSWDALSLIGLSGTLTFKESRNRSVSKLLSPLKLIFFWQFRLPFSF